MGGKQCKAVIEYDEARRQLRKDQFDEIKESFCMLSESKSKNTTISKEKMSSWLRERYLWNVHTLILDRFVQLFDINSDGVIEFSEFLIASYVMRYAPDHYRLKQIFNVFDLDGTGRITKKGFSTITAALSNSSSARTSQGVSAAPVVETLLKIYTSMSFLHASLEPGSQGLSFNAWRRYAQSSTLVNALLDTIDQGREVKQHLPTPKMPGEFHKTSRIHLASSSMRFGPFTYIPSRKRPDRTKNRRNVLNSKDLKKSSSGKEKAISSVDKSTGQINDSSCSSKQMR
mmetsp:Transcript_27191/g.37837  ORF Transcript_27191/g.37837 Transcript_27191/m.37837 type:complete len:287 (+) Transcript_27191:105-965(+)